MLTDLFFKKSAVVTTQKIRPQMNLNQITITVKDIKRSIGFYEKLGMRLIVNSGQKPYARFECPDGGTTFSLHEGENFAPSGAAFYFEVDDVDAACAKLKENGIQTSAPEDKSWLWREAWTEDPDGYRICIFKAGNNRRHPPWRINS